MLSSDFQQSDSQDNNLQKFEFPVQYHQSVQHSNLVKYKLIANKYPKQQSQQQQQPQQRINSENIQEDKVNTYKNPTILTQKLGQKLLFTSEFEINDVPLNVRNILTKGQIQDEIGNFSGTSISTRGRYISPTDKSRDENSSRVATSTNTGAPNQFRPLYLFIQGASKASVSRAIKKINKIIQNNSNRMNKFVGKNNLLQQTATYSSIPSNTMAPVPNILNAGINMNQHPQQLQTAQNTSGIQEQQISGPFFEKVIVGLDHAPAAFNLREQIIGAGGANLAYIQNETGAITQLRGRGSFYIDPNLGMESPESLFIYIEHQRLEGLQAAKQLAKNLIETLQSELAHFQQINGLPVNQPQINQSTIQSNTTTLQQQQQQHQLLPTQLNITQRIPPHPPILAVPPPTLMQQNQTDSGQTTILHHNFVQQNQPPPPPPTLGAPPQTVQSQPTIIHQQIIPQTVPFQIQQNNMVLHQQSQQTPVMQNPSATTITNIPPPGISIPLKTGQLIQVQQPPPQLPQLNQPPPNVQLQQSAPGTQIVLNHPQNYQYQYIQQQIPQTGEVHMTGNQQMSIQPIQSIYQPTQQQIQIQPTMITGNGNQIQQGFDQNQMRQTQQQFHTPVNTGTASQQQYIVQGNAAYMVPQPQTTIIHHQALTTHPGQSSQNIIFQQPHQIQQIPMQQPISIQNIPPPSIVSQTNSQFHHLQQQRLIQQQQQQQQQQNLQRQQMQQQQQLQLSQETGTQDQTEVKEEIKTEENGATSPSSSKAQEDGKCDDAQNNDESSTETATNSSNLTSQSATTSKTSVSSASGSMQQNLQQNQISAINMQHNSQLSNVTGSIAHSQSQTTTPVQHLVGNALIASTPTVVTSSANHVITTQIPVSMHQMSHGGQQYVVSAAPQTFQNIQQPIQVQSIMQPGMISSVAGTNHTIQQTFQQIQHPNGLIQNVHISNAPQTHQAASVNINPTNQQAVSVQLQHQPVQVQLQSLNQIQNIEQPATQVQIGQQIHIPHQQQFIIQNQNLQQPQIQNIMNIQQQQQQQQQQAQNVINQFQQQQYKHIPMSDQQIRMIGHKRKFNDDEIGPPIHQPRMGIGQQARMPVTMINMGQQHHQPPPPPPPSISISQSAQNSSNSDQIGGNKNNISDEIINQNKPNDGQQEQQQTQHLVQQQQRQNFYQESFSLDGPPPRPMQRQMVPGAMQQHAGPRLPRFNQMMNNNGAGNFQMRPNFRQMPPDMMNQGHQVGMHPMHRINYNNGVATNLASQTMPQQQHQQQQQQQQPPPQQQQQYRNDCPPNMNGGANFVHNPRFRGQW